MNIIDGGVTSPKGFFATGVHAGIKKDDSYDMACVFSSYPCTTAGCFTTNVVKAAPVKWDREIVDSGKPTRAIIINSGVANACTGEEGMRYCKETAEAAAEAMEILPENVLVASTGVIGYQLPMDAIKNGIKKLTPQLGSQRSDAFQAATAIMTTDTRQKEVAVTVEIGKKIVTVAGMCKGAGMIHPNMATMLCFITTDCAISHACLQKLLSDEVVDTFNMISVDGDTSTNDTVLVLANGQAENPSIEAEGEDMEIMRKALHYVLEELSKKIAGDGEGCTCLFECQVKHARTKEAARTLAKSVITSSLTKAMIFGHDANCGRVLCALGYSGETFDPEKVDVFFESAAGKVMVMENGAYADFSEEEATKILSEPYVVAVCDMHDGEEEATAWGCDLTYDYVKINGDYRS